MNGKILKAIYYFGFALFTIGIILYFTRQFKPDLLPSIEDFYIEIIWPIGMIIYSFALIFIQANKKKAAKAEQVKEN